MLLESGAVIDFACGVGDDEDDWVEFLVACASDRILLCSSRSPDMMLISVELSHADLIDTFWC